MARDREGWARARWGVARFGLDFDVSFPFSFIGRRRRFLVLGYDSGMYTGVRNYTHGTGGEAYDDSGTHKVKCGVERIF